MIRENCSWLLKVPNKLDARKKDTICCNPKYGWFKEKGCSECSYYSECETKDALIKYYTEYKEEEKRRSDIKGELFKKEQEIGKIQNTVSSLQNEISGLKHRIYNLTEDIKSADKRFLSVMNLLEEACKVGIIDLELLIKTVNAVSLHLYYKSEKASAGNSESRNEEYNMGLKQDASIECNKYEDLYKVLCKKYEDRLNARIDFEECSYGIDEYRRIKNNSAIDEMKNLV